MAKEKLGTKRLCESCGGKFYDLDRDPIVCPLCDTPFIVEKPKVEKPKPKARPKPRPRPQPEEQAAQPEKQAAQPEKQAAQPETETVPEPVPEFVSLDDTAEEEENDDEAKLADLGDDEVEIPPEDNQDAFLEEDEEDAGSDVSGIIGTPVEPKDDR